MIFLFEIYVYIFLLLLKDIIRMGRGRGNLKRIICIENFNKYCFFLKRYVLFIICFKLSYIYFVKVCFVFFLEFIFIYFYGFEILNFVVIYE